MRKWIVVQVLLSFVASSVSFAAEPVRLGFIYMFSGRAALHGQVAKQGAKFALGEINRAGGTCELLNLGLRMPQDLWIGSSYWPQANPKGVDRDFAQGYLKKYGSPPGYITAFAYAGAKAYAQAARTAGSTDKEDLVKALEGLSFDSPVGTLVIRPEDHQGIFHLIGGKVSKKLAFTRRRRPCRALESVILFPGFEVTPSVEETKCKIKW